MRLSELIARCADQDDPIIGVDGPYGQPLDIVDVELGLVILDNGATRNYACLITCDENDER